MTTDRRLRRLAAPLLCAALSLSALAPCLGIESSGRFRGQARPAAAPAAGRLPAFKAPVSVPKNKALPRLEPSIGALPAAKAAYSAAESAAPPDGPKGPLEGLNSAGKKIAQAGRPGDEKAEKALAELFTGTSGSSFVDDLAGLAKSLYFPQLKPHQKPPVVISRAPKAAAVQAVPSDDALLARMNESPLSNPEREAAVIRLFQEAGARKDAVVRVPAGKAPPLDVYDTVIVQDAGRGRSNIFVVKKGRSERVIVDSAHNDKVSVGHGTIDNWTGSMMVVAHYEALKDVETDSNMVFAAFAREEEGLLGSEAFVKSLTPRQKARLFADQNLDTLGVDGTFSWQNNSTRWMLDRIMETAQRFKYELQETYLDGGDSDSSTFLSIEVPGMTVFGASPEKIFDIANTAADTIAFFSMPHFKNAYLLTLEFLKVMDKLPARPEPAGA